MQAGPELSTNEEGEMLLPETLGTTSEAWAGPSQAEETSLV